MRNSPRTSRSTRSNSTPGDRVSETTSVATVAPESVEGRGPEPSPNEECIWIEPAVWPYAFPHPKLPHFFSVISGNTHLHWAFHRGGDQQYTPETFWKTGHLEKDVDLNRMIAREEGTDLITLVQRYLPTKVFREFFGGSLPSGGRDSLDPEGLAETTEQALAFLTSQRIPVLTVYLLSTNPRHERGLCFLFRDVPCNIYRLSATDFFSPEQGVYPSMGVDRVAALKAATHLSGWPALVIDGGTAMTYTMGRADQTLAGGGINVGLQTRWQALHASTGALPLLSPQQVDEVVKHCADQKEPLPVFADNTVTAMITSVLHEVALGLGHVIHCWLKEYYQDKAEKGSDTVTSPEAHEDREQKATDTASRQEDNDQASGHGPTVVTNSSTRYPVVYVTGGDGETLAKLLSQNHSNILATDDYVRVIPQNFNLHYRKHLIHYGVQYLFLGLKQKLEPKSDDDLLREQLIGQRVAKDFVTSDKAHQEPYLGTVVSVRAGQPWEADLYKVFYDDGDREELDVMELHNALLYYSRVSEKKKSEGLAARIEIKQIQAKNAAQKISARLEQSSQSGKKRSAKGSDIGEADKRSKIAEVSNHPGKDVPFPDHVQTTAPQLADEDVSGQNDGREPGYNVVNRASQEAARIEEAADTTNQAGKIEEGAAARTIKTEDGTGKGDGGYPKKLQSANDSRREKAQQRKLIKICQAWLDNPSGDPRAFVGRRVAKQFETGLYFGTIRDYSPPISNVEKKHLWAVVYDDEDTEDYDSAELNQQMILYEKYKDDDEHVVKE